MVGRGLGDSMYLGLLLFLFSLGLLLNYYLRERPRMEEEKQHKQQLIRQTVFDKSLYQYSSVGQASVKNMHRVSPIPIQEYLEYWAYELYTKRNERSVFGFTNMEGRVFFEFVVTGNPVSVRVGLHGAVQAAKTVGAAGILNLHNHFSRKEYGPNLAPSDADIIFALSLMGWCYHNSLKFEGAYITSRGELQEYTRGFFQEAEMDMPVMPKPRVSTPKDKVLKQVMGGIDLATECATGLDTLKIDVFQSAGLIDHIRYLAKLAEGEDKNGRASLATAAILVGSAAMEALLSEAAYLIKPQIYDNKFKYAGVPQKFERLTKERLDGQAAKLWEYRCALTHSEPDNKRSTMVGEKIKAGDVNWVLKTVVELAYEAFGDKMPGWLEKAL